MVQKHGIYTVQYTHPISKEETKARRLFLGPVKAILHAPHRTQIPNEPEPESEFPSAQIQIRPGRGGQPEPRRARPRVHGGVELVLVEQRVAPLGRALAAARELDVAHVRLRTPEEPER